MEQDRIGEATWSPEDEKLRLYPFSRLDDETYGILCGVRGHKDKHGNWDRGLGFKWAPKQELFYAYWTPERERVLLELCGDIGDETMTLLERAEQRAGRYQGYSENAIDRADSARESVDRLASAIPLGQPILVGHHSERHARRDAERIEAGMRRTIDELKRADYWETRAAGSLRHARQSSSARTVHNRIKKLKAEIRKRTRRFTSGERDWCLTLDSFLYHCRKQGIDPAEIEDRAEKLRQEIEQKERVWIEHLETRLAYERATYGDGPKIAVEREEMPDLEIGGAVSYWGGIGGPIVRINKDRAGEFSSVSIMDSYRPGGREFRRTVKAADIRRVLSKQEFEQLGRSKVADK